MLSDRTGKSCNIKYEPVGGNVWVHHFLAIAKYRPRGNDSTPGGLQSLIGKG